MKHSTGKCEPPEWCGKVTNTATGVVAATTGRIDGQHHPLPRPKCKCRGVLSIDLRSNHTVTTVTTTPSRFSESLASNTREGSFSRSRQPLPLPPPPSPECKQGILWSVQHGCQSTPTNAGVNTPPLPLTWVGGVVVSFSSTFNIRQRRPLPRPKCEWEGPHSVLFDKFKYQYTVATPFCIVN